MHRRLALIACACFVACNNSSPVVAVPCEKESDCPTGQSCSAKGCVACPVCDSADRCVGGECLPINCGQLACHSGQGCLDGACVDGLCIGVVCPDGESCVEGMCVDRTCAGVTCPLGQVCVDNSCASTACVGVICPAGELCADGACLPSACDGGSCLPGSVCYQNDCVETLCVGVLCPGGELCTGGLCLPTACGTTVCAAGQVCLLDQCVFPGGGPPDAGSVEICIDGGTGCSIDGGTYACGALEPGNACASCQPAVTSTGWTAFADGNPCAAGDICGYGACVPACFVGEQLLPPGVLDPTNPCQACQPMASTQMFTSIADGTPCATGKRCVAGTCTAGCQIAGASYAAGALNLLNPCEVCQPSTLTTAWSIVTDGTACAQGADCEAGVCTTECFIGGARVATGALDPANLCESCQPSSSASSYTHFPDGTACGGSGHCGAGACVCGGNATLCGVACVDERTNGANCGACATACGLDAGLPDGGLAQTACFNRTCALPAKMPEARSSHAAATGPDGLIYLFGGTTAGFMYYNPAQCLPQVTSVPVSAAVLAYNPLSNSWSQPTSMPTPRLLLGAVTAHDGRLYTVGGATRDIATGIPIAANTVEVYDTVAKSWSFPPALPTPRFGLGVTVGKDGRIYAIGGCSAFTGFRGQAPQYYCSSVVATVEAYQPDAGTWSTLAPLPSPTMSLEAVTGNDGRIYAIGGDLNCSVAEVYDPATNMWSSTAGTVNACYAGAVAGLDGRLFVVGGAPGSPYACGPSAGFTDARYLSAFTLGATAWQQLASLSIGHAALAAAVGPDGRIYAFGGLTPADDTSWPTIDTVEVFDPAVSVWAP